MSGDGSAVVFDLDGVLADSSAVMRKAFAIAYAETVGAGEPPFTEYRRHMGRYFPDIMRLMGLPLAMEGPFVRASAEFAAEIPVYDGVPAMLRRLRGHGLRLAVATGKSGPRARALLDQLGLLTMFDVVTGGDEIARPKPAPDIVVRSLQQLGVPSARAMMVGDAPADIRSAQSAGVCAVAATWGTEDEAELIATGPDVIVGHPIEVADLADDLGLTLPVGSANR
jgi:AHBA synthesis associated protein